MASYQLERLIHTVCVWKKRSQKFLCNVWSAKSGRMEDALSGRRLYQHWRKVLSGKHVRYDNK